MRPTISPFMFMKLRHRFNKYIKHPTQLGQAFSSKLWKCSWEHIDKILFIVFLLLVALAVAVAVEVPENIVGCLKELLGLSKKGKYDVLKAIGFCIVGVLLVLQALAANKRAKAMEDATKNTEEGQRQERLKNAIEHLGHKSDSVRMGGAYELFHLAKDTRDLRQTVMDILCAHIRQTTGEDEYKEKHKAEPSEEKHKAEPSEEKHKAEPSEEIQGLLTLLFMDEHDIFEGCSINLQGSYLNGATLIQARLKKANLREAQLQEADLNKAQLQKANLGDAQLQKAKLGAAQLQKANLRWAQLQEADLRHAQLQGADLTATHLHGGILMEAQLQGADLMAVLLQGAYLSKARMQGADLGDARLQGADLRETQLQGANLWFAHMQEANLGEAQLQGVSNHEDDYLSSTGFESRIKNRTGKPSDLTGIIFAGGFQGNPASHELPPNSGAVTGTYTQEEAEQWIAEYNEAMEGVPSANDTANDDSASDSDKDKED